jgi:hypothetical protein
MTLVAALGREPVECGFLPNAATHGRFIETNPRTSPLLAEAPYPAKPAALGDLRFHFRFT